MATLFVPGIGADGPDTWPTQSGAAELAPPGDAIYLTLDRDHPAGAEEHARQILATDDDVLDLVAHSYGSVAALLAAAADARIRSLVLFEPACMSVAPDSTAVRAFVATMTPYWDRADDPSLSDGEFAGHFLVAFGYRRPPEDDAGAIAFGRRLRSAAPAWAFDVDPGVCARIPSLVVTGGWHPIYEDIADAIAARGAERRTIPGTEHRPQDAPEANTLLNEFWGSLA